MENVTWSSSELPDLLRMTNIRNWLSMIVPPFLVTFGVCGNVLSLAVMCGRHFQRSPSAFLLSALAMVDSLVLLIGPLRPWLHSVADINIRATGNAVCKGHYFLSHLVTHLSAWTLVLINIERVLSVLVPFKAKKFCSRSRMIMAWFAVLAGLVATNVHALWTVSTCYDWEERENVCSFRSPYSWFGEYVWPWLDLTLLWLIPFCVIVISNAIIWLRMWQKSRTSTLRSHTGRASLRQRSLTLMLLALGMAFLCTTSPISIYLIVDPFWEKESQTEKDISYTMFVVFNNLQYVNNAINFLLYCASGSKFRHALGSMCSSVRPCHSLNCYQTLSLAEARTTPHTMSARRVPHLPTMELAVLQFQARQRHI